MRFLLCNLMCLYLYEQDICWGFVLVCRIIKDYNIIGVYGFFVEFLECEEKFFIVFEVIVGNRYSNKLYLGFCDLIIFFVWKDFGQFNVY